MRCYTVEVSSIRQMLRVAGLEAAVLMLLRTEYRGLITHRLCILESVAGRGSLSGHLSLSSGSSPKQRL